MAKLHVKSQYGGTLASGHDSWKDWILEWVPSELDQIMAKYDKSEEKFNTNARMATDGSENISAAPKRVARVEPQIKRTPLNVPRFAPRTDPAVEAAKRRTAAQESFQKQVRDARAHAASVLAKIGNGR